MRLKDKVAVVTGGASGIGRATAELFAHEGARVAVADYSADGRETVQAIKNAGGEAMFVSVDVSDSGQVAKMVEAAFEAFGRIDILFNGAGVLYYGTVLETDERAWNRVISINLTGTYLCCRAVLPHMIRQGGGSIINVASTVGAHDACANAVAYVTSKGGVTLFTKAMAIDHAKQGVRRCFRGKRGHGRNPKFYSSLRPREIPRREDARAPGPGRHLDGPPVRGLLKRNRVPQAGGDDPGGVSDQIPGRRSYAPRRSRNCAAQPHHTGVMSRGLKGRQ